ncbi:hypothetical protein [Evansella cellulosilytica]|uniref:Uncharacterized protein n=1 Tax=Evansella cellulosilytica (strain ATCC 21833 / DSM 2522 / FERM P-1141 / JCM 9156 / N-4) TaxID=649639 RepID=E6TUW8_EVAC2|nr:hypothetical protein [Evansella cellulosilytica]ADU32120.1 hypothetical protein Bcell_3881 [Evansella cellulosilytica DSM 2522]
MELQVKDSSIKTFSLFLVIITFFLPWYAEEYSGQRHSLFDDVRNCINLLFTGELASLVNYYSLYGFWINTNIILSVVFGAAAILIPILAVTVFYQMKKGKTHKASIIIILILMLGNMYFITHLYATNLKIGFFLSIISIVLLVIPGLISKVVNHGLKKIG